MRRRRPMSLIISAKFAILSTRAIVSPHRLRPSAHPGNDLHVADRIRPGTSSGNDDVAGEQPFRIFACRLYTTGPATRAEHDPDRGFPLPRPLLLAGHQPGRECCNRAGIILSFRDRSGFRQSRSRSRSVHSCCIHALQFALPPRDRNGRPATVRRRTAHLLRWLILSLPLSFLCLHHQKNGK